MSFLGGINPISLLATSALGPLGGIISQLATQVISQIGQELIQKLGQQLDVPQQGIDIAKGAFAESVGDTGGGANNLDDAINDLGQATGASPSDIGSTQRDMQKVLDSLNDQFSQSDDCREAKGNGKAGNWLVAMAKALGAKLDKLADKMSQQANEIDEGKPSASQDFTVTAQQFGILMNATTTAIKTAGEALSNAARKQ